MSTRRISLDLQDRTVRRLEELRAALGATSYAEVVRAALRALEREVGGAAGETPPRGS